MKLPSWRSPTLGVAIALALGTAPAAVEAQDDGEAVIEYRQGIMQSFRAHMGGVNAALANTVPMDHALNHAVAFHRMAESLANAFPDGSMSDNSRALAIIWDDRDGFLGRVTAIQSATANLVEAAESGDADAIGTALQGVQGTCRECHSTYRGPAN